MIITLENIAQYPNPDLLAFLQASTGSERRRLLDRLSQDTFTIIDTSQREFKEKKLTLLEIASALGKSEHVQLLLKTKKPEAANVVEATYLAAENGHMSVVSKLLSGLSVETRREYLKYIFRSALKSGDLKLINWLYSYRPTFTASTVELDNNFMWECLTAAVKSGKTEVVAHCLYTFKWDEKISTFDLQNWAQTYGVYRDSLKDLVRIVLKDGDEAMLTELKKLKSYKDIASGILRFSLSEGEALHLEWLWPPDGDSIPAHELEKARDTALQSALRHGNAVMYKQILQTQPLNSAKIRNVIRSGDLTCVKETIEQRDAEPILLSLTDNSLLWRLQEACNAIGNHNNIRCQFFYNHEREKEKRAGTFASTARTRRETTAIGAQDLIVNQQNFATPSDLIAYLYGSNPTLKDRIYNQFKRCLNTTVGYSRPETTTPEIDDLYVICNIVKSAVRSGNIKMLETLWQENHEEMRAFFNKVKCSFLDKSFPMLNYAIESGNPAMLGYLLSECGYFSYRIESACHAIHYGTLELLQPFLDRISSSMAHVESATNELNHLYVRDKREIENALMGRFHLHIPNDPIILMLMSSVPEIFRFVAAHSNYFDELYTKPLIQKTITDVMSAEQELSDEQARFCFEIMLYLISQNTDEGNATIQNLLLLPKVLALAHTQENLLLTRSLTKNNSVVATALLAQPDVFRLAEMNNFYHSPSNAVDVRSIVNNRESAMRALNNEQQKFLAYIEQQYASTIQEAGGIERAYDTLKNTLKDYYKINPIKYTKQNGEVIDLPLERDDFDLLELSVDEHSAALSAYYQHPLHTAIRYLSKPNRWLSPDAKFVDRENQCADFNDHLKNILSLWYAASDKTKPTTLADWTIEGRIEYWINCIAGIGRAHNWDNSRVNEATQISEEYDDLEADKPSCGLGVLQRLVKSLMAYPLKTEVDNALPLLTEEVLASELAKFVRKNFEDKLNLNNAQRILEVLSDNSDDPYLSSFDIPIPHRTAFVQSLAKEFNSQSVNLLLGTIQSKFQKSPHVTTFWNELQNTIMNFSANKLSDFRRELLLYQQQISAKGCRYTAFADKISALITLIDNNTANMLSQDEEVRGQAIQLCQEKLDNLYSEATQHRGFGGLHPIIRGFLGILSILTIIPAVTVSITSQHGFKKTFFGDYPTQAAAKCQFFKNAFKEMSGEKEQPSSDESAARNNKL